MKEYSLTEQYIRTTKALAKATMARRASGPSERTHMRILRTLKLQPEIRQSQLLYLLDVPYESLEGALGDLEYDGYIRRTRQSDPAVTLTDRGAEVAGQTGKGDTDDLFACLDEEERELLKGYLERIEDSLADEAEELDMGFANGAGWMARAAFFGSNMQGRFGPRCD